MSDINLQRLSPVVTGKIEPFLREVLQGHEGNIHSIHVVGSALTPDYDEKRSDINTIVVLKMMDLKFVEFLAPLGKNYRKKGVAAPLIMTPDYITGSLDVFPIEFLDFQLIHETVYGEDVLKHVEIAATDLRNQCEREIKSKLIGLRQGYISSLGDRKVLTDGFAQSIAGYMPLFRGIISLVRKVPPAKKSEVIAVLSDSTGINTDIFGAVLDIREGKRKPGKEELDKIFEDYYRATEQIGKLIDEYQI